MFIKNILLFWSRFSTLFFFSRKSIIADDNIVLEIKIDHLLPSTHCSNFHVITSGQQVLATKFLSRQGIFLVFGGMHEFSFAQLYDHQAVIIPHVSMRGED